jgi:hypothetical protein
MPFAPFLWSVYALTKLSVAIRRVLSKQAEYGVWCQRHAHVFQSVASDAAELSRCQSDLRVATGGNPLMLNSFYRNFNTFAVRHAHSVSFESDLLLIRIFVVDHFRRVSCIQTDGSFQTCFDRWHQNHECEIGEEMECFLSKLMTPSNEHMFINGLLGCISGEMLGVGPGFYDHRHMFQIPERNQLVAVFIASPFLPADSESLQGTGVCSSGIAKTAAAKLLHSVLNAGSLCPTSQYLSALPVNALILTSITGIAVLFLPQKTSFRIQISSRTLWK